MSYYGDIRLGDTIDIKFTTRQISGAPFTLAGSPVISAYPANSTTQLTAGITLSVDFDGVTGLNNIRVVASGGNGYLTATNYELVITTGTVNGVSVVGECVGGFSIENRSALMPTTAARTLVVDAAGLADANTVKLGPTGSGTAQTARDVGASVLLSAGAGAGQLDFTAGVVKANLAQILGTALTETAGQIAAAFKKFFNVATPASTMDALTLVATATAVTNDVGITQAGADKVWGTAARTLTAGTNIVLAKGTGVTGFNDLSAAQVNTEADTALSDVGLTSTVTGRIDAAISTRATPAQVKTQVVDGLATDTYAEPGQATPPATTTLATKIGYLYKLLRNKKTQTATAFSLFNSGGAVVDQKSTVSDDGTTATRGELGTGP